MAQFTADAQAAPSGIRSNSSTQEAALGTKVVTSSGRAFRYVKVGGTTLVVGTLLDAPATIGNHTNIAVQAAAAAGATSVSVTLGATAVVVDQYADGVLVINDVTGEGQTFTIASHLANAGSGTLVVNLTPDEPVVTALTTSSEASLVSNQYNGVVIHASTEAAAPIGVAVTAITNAQFGWIQTRGPVSCLCNATLGIGLSAAASDTTGAGGVEVGDGILSPVGYAIAAGVATEYNPIFLTID